MVLNCPSENSVQRSLLMSCVLVLAGCGNVFYSTKDYHVGDTKTAYVGAAMVSWEEGEKKSLDKTIVEGVRRELVYNGVSDSTIFVAYREYTVAPTQSGAATYIRPAFSNEMKYSMRGNSVITYQEMRLEVIDANSQLIRFKILKDFDTRSTLTEAAGMETSQASVNYYPLEKRRWVRVSIKSGGTFETFLVGETENKWYFNSDKNISGQSSAILKASVKSIETLAK